MDLVLTLLALLPIVSLFVCLVVLKLSVPKSGVIALGIALVVAIGFFGLPLTTGLPIAVGKAMWLALFVALIVWFALFLYHIVSDFGAIEVITKNITIFVKDEFVAFLWLAWLFTGFLQGIAGFGVPAAIVTPILIALGHNPIKSLAAAMLGHSWAVTFGSMGAAYFVVAGLTGMCEADLALPMWLFNTVAHFMTGILVCFLYGGFKGIRKGILYVLPVSIVMTVVQFGSLWVGMFALAGLNAAIVGLIVMFVIYKLRTRDKAESGFYKGKLTLFQALLPYALIVVLLLSFQLIDVFDGDLNIRNRVAVSPSFSGFTTGEGTTLIVPGIEPDIGHEVRAEPNYNPIRLFVHPVFVLIVASLVAIIIYKRNKVYDRAIFNEAVKKTVRKGIPATLALLALGTMSFIMMDSGMTRNLAFAIADLVGGVFPIFSGAFGVFGSFLTGNNTNSNILFGMFQFEIANSLGFSTAMFIAAQSIGGAVGVSVAPTLVLTAALVSDQKEAVPIILRKLLPLALLIALVMGVVNILVLGTSFGEWIYQTRCEGCERCIELIIS